jgi:hypothetical protein
MAVYGPGCHPQNIIWSINCYLARSAINYLLYYTQYLQICQSFCYCISKTKNELGQNPEENIILTGPGQYTKILTGSLTKTNMDNKNVKDNIIQL